jgi:asparagine synthase (glutamine-hydrolysing)
MDRDLLAWAATVPSKHKIHGSSLKHIVRKAMDGRIPEQLTSRGKQGFGTPLGRWFRHELSDYLNAHLLESELARDGYLDQEYLTLMLRAHRKRWRNMGEVLWTLLSVEVWYRTWIKQIAPM